MTEPESKSPKFMLDSLSEQALESLERSTCSQKIAECIVYMRIPLSVISGEWYSAQRKEMRLCYLSDTGLQY